MPRGALSSTLASTGWMPAAPPPTGQAVCLQTPSTTPWGHSSASGSPVLPWWLWCWQVLSGPWVCPPARDSSSGTANTCLHYEPRRVLGPLCVNSWSLPAALGVGPLLSPTDAETTGDIGCIRTPAVPPQRPHTRTFRFIRSGRGPGDPTAGIRNPFREPPSEEAGDRGGDASSPGPPFPPLSCPQSAPRADTSEHCVRGARSPSGLGEGESTPAKCGFCSGGLRSTPLNQFIIDQKLDRPASTATVPKPRSRGADVPV